MPFDHVEPRKIRPVTPYSELEKLISSFGDLASVLCIRLCRLSSYPLRPRRLTWIKTKRESVKSGYFRVLSPNRIDLSCKTNKCSVAGTGNIAVLTFRDTTMFLR